jgi:hypothetical protein
MAIETPRRKKHTALWIGGGVLLLAVLLAVAAVMFPPAQYTFLRGARLRSIEIIDYKAMFGSMGTPLPPGTPDSMTMKLYTTEADFKAVVAQMQSELTAAKGWIDPMAGYPGAGATDMYPAGFATFTHGSDSAVYAITKDDVGMGFPYSGDLHGGKTVIMVMGETTLFDRLIDKVHQDETPPVMGGTTGSTIGGRP